MGALATVPAMSTGTATPAGTLLSVAAVVVEPSPVGAAAVLERPISVTAEAVEAPLTLPLGGAVAVVVFVAAPSAVAGVAARASWVDFRQLLGTTSTARRRAMRCRRRVLVVAAVVVAVERRRPAPRLARVRLQARMPPYSRE